MNRTLLFLTVLLGVAVAMAAAHEADSVTVEKQTARVLSAAAKHVVAPKKSNSTKKQAVVGGANDSNIIIFVAGAIGILFALFQNYLVMSIPLTLTRIKTSWFRSKLLSGEKQSVGKRYRLR